MLIKHEGSLYSYIGKQMKTNMTNDSRKTMSRLLSLFVLLVTLIGMLAGCAQSQTTTTTFNRTQIRSADITEDCALTAEQLNDILDMLESTYNANNMNTPVWLVAASRGYDMTAEDFDDSKVDPTVVKEPDVVAARNIIALANNVAKDDKRLDLTYKAITAADLTLLVGAMQTTVELKQDSGVLNKIYYGIGVALEWMTNTLCFGSYLLGICLFAIVIEILLLPFAIKQQKTSIRQAKLQPKEMAIRKKYAGRDDQVTRQKLNDEIQELYQRENYSPLSGCLPLLIQLPIVMVLYNIVIDPLRYMLGQPAAMSGVLNIYYTTARAAGGLGHIAEKAGRGTISLLAQLKSDPAVLEGLKDFPLFRNSAELYESMANVMDSVPNFMLGKINLGNNPVTGGILILVPILTFAVYFLSMRLTKKFTYQPTATTGTTDKQVACSNWMMDISMPLMSAWFSLYFPALVGIYWMFKSVISTLTRFIISRVMPYPKFTEEDYRAAEREYAGKAPRPNQPSRYSYGPGTTMVGGKPKSLFHMDDDDYLAKIEQQEKQDAAQADAKAGKKAADSGIRAEQMQQDDRHGRTNKKKK